MAAVSLSTKRGANHFLWTSYTVGTLAPNADDVEIRFNLTDSNGKNLTRKDIVNILDHFERILMERLLVTAPPL